MRRILQRLSLAALGTTLIISVESAAPTIAAELKFNILASESLAPSAPFPLPPRVYAAGTFSYNPEVSSSGHNSLGHVVKSYPLTAFSLNFYSLYSFDGPTYSYFSSIDSAAKSYCQYPNFYCIDYYTSGSLTIDPGDSISLSFGQSFSGAQSNGSYFGTTTASVSYAYKGITDSFPDTTEEFLAALGTVQKGEYFYSTKVYPVRSGSFDKATITAVPSSKPVPESSSVGAFGLLSLGWLLKRKLALF